PTPLRRLDVDVGLPPRRIVAPAHGKAPAIPTPNRRVGAVRQGPRLAGVGAVQVQGTAEHVERSVLCHDSPGVYGLPRVALKIELGAGCVLACRTVTDRPRTC